MEPSPEVAQLSAQLIRAVEISMSPTASSQERRNAYEACEQFKETSPMCAECGLYLAQLPNIAIVRHFGLQLMEHCVKYRWNKMTQAEKLFIKVYPPIILC
jgi:exportin-5